MGLRNTCVGITVPGKVEVEYSPELRRFKIEKSLVMVYYRSGHIASGCIEQCVDTSVVLYDILEVIFKDFALHYIGLKELDAS